MKRYIHNKSDLRTDLFEELYEDGHFTSKHEMNAALDINWTDVTPEDSAALLETDQFNPKAISKVEYLPDDELGDYDFGYIIHQGDGEILKVAGYFSAGQRPVFDILR